MNEYHKIHTIFKRDAVGKIIEGEYSRPEFEYLVNNIWQWDEKVDGTNIRVMWDGVKIRFGGKTDNAQIPIFLMEKLQFLFSNEEIFKNIFGVMQDEDPLQVCLYGEGYGRKIQKVGASYIPDGVSFVLFDVKIGHWWLKREDVIDIANKFNIQYVPIVGSGTLADMIVQVRGGIKSTWGDFMAEGLVARPKVELIGRDGNRIITKLKHRDFNHLLK